MMKACNYEIDISLRSLLGPASACPGDPLNLSRQTSACKRGGVGQPVIAILWSQVEKRILSSVRVDTSIS